jgi:TolA-binding protein
MKTENVSQADVPFAQTKSIREDKSEAKKETNKTLGDVVNLSTKGFTVSTPVASYQEALNMIKNMDFSQATDAHNIFTSVTARFMEILQTSP